MYNVDMVFFHLPLSSLSCLWLRFLLPRTPQKPTSENPERTQERGSGLSRVRLLHVLLFRRDEIHKRDERTKKRRLLNLLKPD